MTLNKNGIIVKIEIPDNKIIFSEENMAIVCDSSGEYRRMTKINENILLCISKVQAMHDGDGKSAFFNAFFKDNGDLIIHSVAEKQEF
jgi:hypothetical protein